MPVFLCHSTFVEARGQCRVLVFAFCLVGFCICETSRPCRDSPFSSSRFAKWALGLEPCTTCLDFMWIPGIWVVVLILTPQIFYLLELSPELPSFCVLKNVSSGDQTPVLGFSRSALLLSSLPSSWSLVFTLTMVLNTTQWAKKSKAKQRNHATANSSECTFSGSKRF